MSRVLRKTHPQAGRLRREATDAERLFRWAVRGRQLADLKFRRQVGLGPYIADFAGVEAKLVVKLDGGQHTEQRLSMTNSAHGIWRASATE